MSKLQHTVFSLFYGLLLYSIPSVWASDRISYLNYVNNSIFIIQEYLDGSLIILFFNEPIWLIINIALSYLGNPNYAIGVLIFINSFFVSYILLRKGGIPFKWVLLTLLFPPIFTMQFSHIRQAVALTIFMAGYFSKNKYSAIIMWLSALIHSSFFIVLPLIYLIRMLDKLMPKSAILVKLFFILIYIYLVIFLMGEIAHIAGARQAQVDFSIVNNSGNAFIFWLAVLVLLSSQGVQYLNKSILPISVLLLYITSYYYNPFIVRVFDNLVLFVLLRGVELRSWRVYVFSLLMLLYLFLSYSILLSKQNIF
jgi:hypothetical protein